MYPAGAPPDKALADNWTWDAFLAAAEKCHKAGVPFGIGLGQTADSVDTMGALFARTERNSSMRRATSRSSPTR